MLINTEATQRAACEEEVTRAAEGEFFSHAARWIGAECFGIFRCFVSAWIPCPDCLNMPWLPCKLPDSDAPEAQVLMSESLRAMTMTIACRINVAVIGRFSVVFSTGWRGCIFHLIRDTFWKRV